MRQIDHRPEIRKMTIKKKHQNPITLAIKQKKRRRRRFKLLGPRLHSELHAEVPGKKLKTSFPTIPEIVRQQPQDPPKGDSPCNTTTKDLNIQTITTTDNAQQTSPPNKIPRLSGKFPGYVQEKTGSKPGSCSNSFPTNPNQTETLTGTSPHNRDDITPSPLTVSSFICELLVKDVESNQTYLPLNASVTPKQKKENALCTH